MTKRFAPLFLVLLAASLWSWTQGPRAPKIVPTRANCSVHGVHLGYDEAQVISGVGKPDKVEPFYPKARDEITVWTWGQARPPSLPTLQVVFEKSRVCSVWGASLSVGSKDYDIDAGGTIEAADFLGSPSGSEQTHWMGDTRTDDFTSWSFPEVAITVLSREVVNQVRIEAPRNP